MVVDQMAPRQLVEGLDVRVGVDVQDIDDVSQSIQAHGGRYLRKLFTEQEIESSGGPAAPAEVLAPGLAARFAAKEAVFKLLHLSTTVPDWADVEIRRAGAGWPEVCLHGTAARLADEQQFVALSVSMSHGGGVGLASVVGIRWAGATQPRA